MEDLTPDHWKQIDTILEAVLEREPAERQSYLLEICGSNTSLYSEIDTLLRLNDEAEKILGESAATYAAPLIPGLIRQFDQDRDSDQDLSPGSELGKYRIISVAGRGGMGTVYRARRADDAYTREVAIKLVRRGMDTGDILRRFHYEQQILASLEHPNIARLHDAGASSDGRPFFVMEYVEGLPIDRYCDEKKLTIRQRLELFIVVCRTVSYAHQKLVVHRDLKPSNILVKPDGTVKLLDFGIARLMDENNIGPDVPLTRTGLHLHTPGYAAPEQITGGQITTASDVFTLGVVLYELLCGHKPYTRNKQGASASVPDDDIGIPSRSVQLKSESLRRSLAGDLDNILLKALRKESDLRYTTPEQLAEDLRRHLDGLPVSARPFEKMYRVRKFIGRHKTGVAIFIMVLLAFIMFTSGLIYLQARTALERDIATIERNKANEVSTFLEELLSSANPYYGTTRADTLRLRDFVKMSTERVRTDLADQPAVKARMINVLGHMHGKLNMTDEALLLLEEALELRTSLYGDQHPEVAETMNDLGLVYHSTGEVERAEHLIRSALGIRLQYGRNEALASSYTTLANLIHDSGDYNLAEEYYRQALDINEEVYGVDHHKTATQLLNLATILQRKGDLDQAETYHLRALAINRDVLGPGHPLVAGSENNLGLLYADRGQNEQAEMLLRNAMNTRMEVFGDEHPQTISSTNNLATVLNDLGRHDEAEHYYRISLNQRIKLYGENSIQVATALNNLAQMMKRSNPGEAIGMTRDAIRIAAEVRGADHPQVGILNGNLAGMIRSNGDPHEAEHIFRASIKILESTLPSDHPSIARQRVGLAECLEDQNRIEEAIELMLTGFQTLVAKGIDASATRASLARLYESAGKTDEAVKYIEVLPE